MAYLLQKWQRNCTENISGFSDNFYIEKKLKFSGRGHYGNFYYTLSAKGFVLLF